MRACFTASQVLFSQVSFVPPADGHCDTELFKTRLSVLERARTRSAWADEGAKRAAGEGPLQGPLDWEDKQTKPESGEVDTSATLAWQRRQPCHPRTAAAGGSAPRPHASTFRHELKDSLEQAFPPRFL